MFDLNSLYHMDCMVGLAQIPDGWFDLAIVDPPYGGATNPDWLAKPRSRFGSRFKRYHIEAARTDGAGAAKYGKKITHWDVAPNSEYFDELFRVSKNQIIWGGNYFELPPTRCFVFWDKKNISETFSMAMGEYAWASFNANGKICRVVPQGRAGERIHPCLPVGEKVFFNSAWVSIEDVKIGDRNAFGVVSGISRHSGHEIYDLQVGAIKTSATWNHPFLALRHSQLYWLEARHIRPGDYLLIENEALCGQSTLPQKDIGAAFNPAGSDWNTTLCGKPITDLSRTGIKSTTSTATSRTIDLKTSCLLRPLNTSGFTLVADLSMGNGKSDAAFAENGNLSPPSIGITVAASQQGKSASLAISAKSARSARFVLRTVGSVKPRLKLTEVVNLSIDGIPAFDTLVGTSHNTQKPVALYEFCLKHYAQPGDKILDTHAGSGSCLIAAHRMGHEFLGFEIDETYCQLATERLKKELG